MNRNSFKCQGSTFTIGLRSDQRGISLIVSLIFLLIMTLLGLSLFRTLNLDEKVAGNTQEKQRSLQAAQSALRYGEWWLTQGNTNTGITCTNSVVTAPIMQICSNPLSSATTLPWDSRIDYLLNSMTVAIGGGVVNTGGDINYFSKPSVYILYMGLDPTGKSMLYQVTAAGYGGTTSGTSVVQSVYALTSKTTPLDQP